MKKRFQLNESRRNKKEKLLRSLKKELSRNTEVHRLIPFNTLFCMYVCMVTLLLLLLLGFSSYESC